MFRSAPIFLALMMSIGGLSQAQSDSPTQTIQALIQSGDLLNAQKRLDALSGPEHQLKRLSGLIALQQGTPQKAANLFKRVIELKPEWKSTYLYLAQAQLQLERYNQALASLMHCEEIGENRPGYYRLLIRAYLGSNQPQLAFTMAEKAHRKFPGRPELRLDRIWVLTKIGLIHTALDELDTLIRSANYPASSITLLARIAREGMQYPVATEALEYLVQSHPEHALLHFEAGLGYSQLKKHHIAARFFERATLLGHPAAFEAADQFRLALQPRKALQLNAQIADKKRLLPQRLTIYLSANNYHRASALKPLLTQHNLLNDDIRFRLGYAFVQIQNSAQANQMANGIESPSRQKELMNLIARIPSNGIDAGIR